MLIGNYGHDPLLGDCYEENQGTAKQAGIMMQNAGSNSSIQEQGLKSPDQGSAGSAARGFLDRRLKPQPNQVLKCPRCESLNTKFCYYNNYSLTQPRHFCKNCRRYWTKGGALRNVPVGGGCRKNKRSKQKSSDQNSHGSDAGGLSGSYGSDCSVPNASLQQRSLSGCSNSGMYSMTDGIDLPGSILPGDLTGRSGLSFSMPLGMHNFDPSALAAMNLGDGSSRHHDSTSKVDLGSGVGVGPMYEPSGGLSLMGSVNTEALSSYSMMNSLLSMELNGELKWRLQQRMSDDHDSKPNAQVFHHFDDVNLKGKSMACLSPPKAAPEPHRSTFGFDHWQQTSHDGLILDPPPPVSDPNCWNYSSVWPPDLPNYGPSGPQLL